MYNAYSGFSEHTSNKLMLCSSQSLTYSGFTSYPLKVETKDYETVNPFDILSDMSFKSIKLSSNKQSLLANKLVT